MPSGIEIISSRISFAIAALPRLTVTVRKPSLRDGTVSKFALAATLQARVRYGAVLFNFQSINKSSSKFTVDVQIIIVESRFTSSVV